MTPAGTFFDPDKKRQKIRELEAEAMKKGFWNEVRVARSKRRELSLLQNQLEMWERLTAEAQSLFELSGADDLELQGDIAEQFEELEKKFSSFELMLLFSGPRDPGSAILSIHAGTGGVDAMDFAGMLLRMYLRFVERRGWRAVMVDESRGQEAGIKSATIEIIGDYAYGYLKAEAGVHRLVRISPFDAEKMRHTSFALVEVMPELDDVEVTLKDDEIRIDTFMSGGHGGQSVNTTYSAIRIVHIPTGITVSCQNERSQLQNKETALKVLKSKLYEYQRAEREEEKARIRGEYRQAVWGNQARSYVLQPYRMVKDHRTEHETADVDRVLNGDLDDFIEAYLRSKK